ncbi:MAG: bifunctional folylpolyglutamate synthase/dihydrofolate synthase [Gammaproteobacteria bacterium]|nr:bifunctional folylpolyglutamate synthase/dihydrofolate synthase [Gammaproteobacteria bacterium]MBT8134144.1 bifunctional folylpolyglutamate synthase/dihydrofolate synthase [Gammaproteobacteria bacterium]NNJ48935.1 bifunctional folylpolyglutamate synthase/dihydrofolate synthase [Gammaproteobacteria bacterium]
MRFEYLDDWLAWQESLNPKEIDLGLDRVNSVLRGAGLASVFNCPLITVAGTNGKGSVVAILEAVASAAGLNVCSYTSPHIFRYNERIKINAMPVDDASLCEAFQRIDQARGEIPLTYFEFGTLAAIDIFFQQQPDLVILEVGLGGRLDAVNAMDADVSILTSVAIDHVDWLGDDRETIGFEKAGIFRQHKTVICGDMDPPQSVVTEAEKKQCEFLQAGRDFDVSCEDDSSDGNWTLDSPYQVLTGLPVPNLAGDFQKYNAASAIVALQALQVGISRFKMIDLALASTAALSKIVLAGRFQKLHDRPCVFVDVAHNPHAAGALSSQLKLTASAEGKTWAIVAMLADKDIVGVLEELVSDIDIWCIAGLDNVPRGMTVEAFIKVLPDMISGPDIAVISEENRHDLAQNQCTMLSETVLLTTSVTNACREVLSRANETDRIIIFGSFYTVTEAMQFFSVNNDESSELRY